MAFNVEVDGETFSVRISPAPQGGGQAEATGPVETGGAPGKPRRPKEAPPGSVVCGMAGLVLSIEAKVGDSVNPGEIVAMIEAMKMRRRINAPHGGVVKEIRVREGDMVDAEDVLMVVA